MAIKSAVLGVMLLVPGLVAGAAPASAQTSLTASLPIMRGGTGITPNGTGFNGSMGDPDYYLPGSSIPESEGHYPGPYGTMGASRPVPGGVPYEVAPPAIEYRFGPPTRR